MLIYIVKTPMGNIEMPYISIVFHIYRNIMGWES